jgi:hypothetical protein
VRLINSFKEYGQNFERKRDYKTYCTSRDSLRTIERFTGKDDTTRCNQYLLIVCPLPSESSLYPLFHLQLWKVCCRCNRWSRPLSCVTFIHNNEFFINCLLINDFIRRSFHCNTIGWMRNSCTLKAFLQLEA